VRGLSGRVDRGSCLRSRRSRGRPEAGLPGAGIVAECSSGTRKVDTGRRLEAMGRQRGRRDHDWRSPPGRRSSHRSVGRAHAVPSAACEL
ncbi:MAG: Alpha/beta hydrolase fold-1, partial [uncultured Chloroflexia bacterium]